MKQNKKAEDILQPYRARIDALDEKIVALLAERINIIREVGVLKFEKGLPPIIAERVDAVREHAASCAEDKGIDPQFVRELYAHLISYCCGLEEEIMQELGATRKAMGE